MIEVFSAAQGLRLLVLNDKRTAGSDYATTSMAIGCPSVDGQLPTILLHRQIVSQLGGGFDPTASGGGGTTGLDGSMMSQGYVSWYFHPFQVSTTMGGHKGRQARCHTPPGSSQPSIAVFWSSVSSLSSKEGAETA